MCLLWGYYCGYMGSRLLVAGPDSALTRELVSVYLAEGRIVALAQAAGTGDTIPAAPRQPDGTAGTSAAGSQVHRLEWNRRSPVSARNVLLECRSLMGGLESAVVVFAPGRDNRAFHETPAGYIEEAVDTGLKGYMFLLRELLGYFQKSGSGTLAVAVHDEGSEILSPVEACVSGSFAALVQSLAVFYQNEPVSIMGFRSSTTQVSEYAQFIRRTLEEKQGKTTGVWHKYSDRPGFFQSLPRGILKK